jgi:hypothetical protein
VILRADFQFRYILCTDGSGRGAALVGAIAKRLERTWMWHPPENGNKRTLSSFGTSLLRQGSSDQNECYAKAKTKKGRRNELNVCFRNSLKLAQDSFLYSPSSISSQSHCHARFQSHVLGTRLRRIKNWYTQCENNSIPTKPPSKNTKQFSFLKHNREQSQRNVRIRDPYLTWPLSLLFYIIGS